MTPMVLVETPHNAVVMPGGGLTSTPTGDGESSLGLFAQLLETAQQQLPFVLEGEPPPIDARLPEQRRFSVEKSDAAEAVLTAAYYPAVLPTSSLGSQMLGDLPELKTSSDALGNEVNSLGRSAPVAAAPESPRAKPLAFQAVSDELLFPPRTTVASRGQATQPTTVVPTLLAEKPIARGDTGHGEGMQAPSVRQQPVSEGVSPTVASTQIAAMASERSSRAVWDAAEVAYSEPSTPTPPTPAAPPGTGRPPLHTPQSPSEPFTPGRYAAPQPTQRGEQVRIDSPEIPAETLPSETASPARQTSQPRERGTTPAEPAVRNGATRLASPGDVRSAAEPVPSRVPLVQHESLEQEGVPNVAAEPPRRTQRAEPVPPQVAPGHSEAPRPTRQEVSSASQPIWQRMSPQGEVQGLASGEEETAVGRAIQEGPTFPAGQTLSEPTSRQNRAPVERQATVASVERDAPQPQIGAVTQNGQAKAPSETPATGATRAETGSVSYPVDDSVAWGRSPLPEASSPVSYSGGASTVREGLRSPEVSSQAFYTAGASTVREGLRLPDTSPSVSHPVGEAVVRERRHSPTAPIDAPSPLTAEVKTVRDAVVSSRVAEEATSTLQRDGGQSLQQPLLTDSSEAKPTKGASRRVVVLQDTAVAASEAHLPQIEKERGNLEHPEPVAMFRTEDVAQRGKGTPLIAEQVLPAATPALEEVSMGQRTPRTEQVAGETPRLARADEPPVLGEEPSVQEEIASIGRVSHRAVGEATPRNEPVAPQVAMEHSRPASSREASPLTVSEVPVVEAPQPVGGAEPTATEAIPSSRTAPGLLSGAPTAEAMKTQTTPSASTVEPVEGEAAPLKTTRASSSAPTPLLGQEAEPKETVPLSSAPAEKGKPERASPKASRTEDAGVEAVSLLATQATSASAGTDRVVVAPSQQEVSRVVQQVVRHLEEMVHTRAQSLTLQLHPEELGQLRITVTLREGSIHTYIVADSSSVRHILESNLSQLHHALQQRGLQLGALQVSVQGDGRQPLTQHQPYVPTWLPANPLASSAADWYEPSTHVGGVNLLV